MFQSLIGLILTFPPELLDTDFDSVSIPYRSYSNEICFVAIPFHELVSIPYRSYSNSI